MAVVYEINPPKISDNVERLEKLYSRIEQMSNCLLYTSDAADE